MAPAGLLQRSRRCIDSQNTTPGAQAFGQHQSQVACAAAEVQPLLTGNEKEGTISFRFFMFLHMPSAPFLKIYIPTFGTMTYVIKDRLVVKQTEEWDGSFLGTTLTHTLNMWEPSVAEFRKLAPNKLTNPQSGTKYELKESLKA